MFSLRQGFLLLACGLSIAAEPVRVVFPTDPSVLNAKVDLGAKGDGKTDDTAALQKGLDANKVLYLPNGTYRVRQTLVVKSALGPWLFGESRDGVILKLDDGVANCNSVLRTHPNESGKTSADWFMRNLRNFTIDVGNNPNTDGIRYYATNSGTLQNVRIRGTGKIGINSGFLDQSGPNLVQDVVVEGFETGILSQWIWSQTLSRVTIRNCRKVGLSVTANVVAAEDLTVENTPLAVLCDQPNDWYWWSGVVSIVGGKFTTSATDGPAILNKGVLYARNLKVQGYATAIQSAFHKTNVAGPDVAEYASNGTKQIFPGAVSALRLPIEREPSVPWETDPTKWECANEHGAKFGDNQDDSAALQKAIDAAAKAGKTTVYLRGVTGGDPNWYSLDQPVRVHGSVRHILGLGFGRVLGSAKGKFIVDDQSAAVVKFQSIDSFGGPPPVIENAGSRTLVVESSGVSVRGSGTGHIFMTDTPALLELTKPGQKVWCRQLNPEGKSDVGLVQNNGGQVWILGMKCEGEGVRVRTAAGGQTEVFGTFIYGPGLKETDQRPIFDVVDGRLSVLGLRELTFGGHTYRVKVREGRAGTIKSLGLEEGHGWIGWSAFHTGK
jgi:hypothetical protein